VHPISGHLVSDLLTPASKAPSLIRPSSKQEALNVAPGYTFDVKDFRTADKAGLLQRIYDLTEVQFRLLEHCLKTKPWDFFIYVNIGVDRIHHGFWRYHDPQHRLHEPNASSPTPSATTTG
jgi:predicted AlkP superfamily phosphohydrolase/phosphomutase